MLRAKHSSEFQLIALAGIISGLLTISQLGLDEILRLDRFQHFFISGSLFLILMMAFQNHTHRVLKAFILAFAVGLLKESFDPTFENFDILANFVGIIIVLLTLLAAQIPLPSKVYYRKRAKSFKA